jgi:ATP-dependent DNA helicase HFM1/MER3
VNKSPFILYPIEENVTKTWHKVSLLVQLHLGGADYPDTSESQKQKQQLRIEKKGIFERLQRLVRCVADCKVHDRDSVSTKSALELVRSLTADAWEDRPSELLQIAHIGPILMRKLVSRGVMRIKDLVHKDPGELAGLLGRNPTFGKTLTDQLKAFPLLSCDVTVPNRKYTFINDGEAISVPLIATLRYLNQAGLPKWRNNVPLVTFVAETTAGLLVYFWKGYLDRIDSSTGLELLFSAEIRTQNERFMCHFSCEEIVGTIVTKTLDHAVPVSAFKKLKPMVQQVEAAALPRTSSNSGPKGAADGLRPARRSDPALWEDALDDEDAIEAAAAFDEGSTPPEDVHNGNRKEDSQQSAQTSYSDGDFPLVEDILAVVDPPKQVSLSLAGLSLTPSSFRTTQEAPSEADTVEKAPVKLPNGKWQCNHACSRGALTKGGKPCAHRCCIEGLDKPRKMKTQEQKLAEAKKRRAVHLLAKKRKGEGELDECSNADTASHGRSIKRIRVSQEPEPSRVTTNTPQKPCSESTGAEDAKDVQGKVSRFVSVDMSDLGENSDFPDVTVLAHSKSKNAASDADDVNVERLSPSWTATETYEPTVPPAATTDYGNLDDLFNEDFEFDFEMPDMAHQVSPSASDTGPLWRMPRDTGGAFKLEGQDTMLTDLALHATPPQLGDWTRSPTPKSYKPVLKEAAKVGDIRFPNMSAYHHMTTALPDLGDLGSLDFGAFDDGSVDGGSMDGDSRDDGSFDEELMAFVEAEDISAEDGTISPRPPSDAFAEAPLGHAPVGQQEPDVKQNTTEGKKKEKEKEAEPAWVAEFDQDFVNSFRGHVNFI